MFDFAPEEPDEKTEISAGPQPAGRGILELTRVAGRTEVTRSFATSPLRFLAPRRRDAAACWVYLSTYGGGLVAGDEIDLQVRVGRGAKGVLGTQASTKVYRSPGRLPCRQKLRAAVEDGGLLVVSPDPLTCFAEADYEQSQSIRLKGSGSLVLVDWITSGRRARGESWAFSRYRSRLHVYRDDELIMADALLLDPADGPLQSPFRLGRFHCLAMVVLIGERLTAAIEDRLGSIAAKPVEPQARLVDVASPLSGGMVMRVVGETTELVSRYLVHALSFLNELVGDNSWARKW